MEFSTTFNPVSSVIFAIVGIGVYFYVQDKPWLLTRWARRTPLALAVLCAILPFPFLFVFVWDVYSKRDSR